MNLKGKNSGFSLVEIVVMTSITAFAVLFLWQTYTAFLKISLRAPSYFQASFLAEEAIEAVKFLRDDDWDANIASLSSGADYWLIFNGSAWEATTTFAVIDNKFDRRIVFDDVYRDGIGDIASSGTLDPGTKKVLVTVAWLNGEATSTRIITTYVSDIFED